LTLTYSLQGWLTLLYIGWVPGALGYVLFQAGLRSLSATIASIVSMCEPLTAAVLAWLLFHEELGPIGLLGAVGLLGAMLVILLTPPPQKQPTSRVAGQAASSLIQAVP
jgi:DME family drug/metabolite transporter